MANSFWMATAEGGGGKASGSREGDQSYLIPYFRENRSNIHCFAK